MDGDIKNDKECIEARIDRLSSLLYGQPEDGVCRFLVGHDGLLDALLALYAECNKEQLMKNKHVSTFVNKYRSTVREIQRLRISVTDFEVKDVIGRGHFGEVQVVRERTSGTVYAMKTLRKTETLSQPDIAFFEEERDIMAQAASPWITQLHYAFQDPANLYLVMEFHPGGDLLSLLSRYDDVFEEDMARFYLAEITMAINDLHCMGYVHRDIKPENVLLDRNGHIKLADFGSAAKLSRNGMVTSKMPVGTPDYVSPELLVAMNSSDGMSKYGVEVDWWSLGICAYEMLFSCTPFTDDNGSMVTTYSNIMNFKACLKFPEDSQVSTDAVSCIRGLLSTTKDRIRFNDICCHSFFKNTDFQHIRDKTPPVIPTVNSQDDTSNFEDFEKLRPQPCVDDFRSNKQGDFSGKDLPFVGFTYTKDLFTHSRAGDMSQFSTYSILENPVQSSSSTTTTSTTATVTTSGSPACSNLEVKLTVKIQELQHVKARCHQLEETESSLKSNIHEMEQSFRQKDEELKVAELSKSTLENDLEKYIKDYQSMKAALDQALEGKDVVDVHGVELYDQIQLMREELQKIERLRDIDDQQLRSEAEDLRTVVSQLEVDREDLTKRLARKQRQLDEYSSQLEASYKRVTEMQTKLDKERRKSREAQRQEFELCQQGEDFWKLQVQERADQIDRLQAKLQTLQSQVETYKCKQMVLTERDTELQDKVTLLEKQNKELLVKMSSSGNQHKRVTDLENVLETKDQEIKELNDTIVKYRLKEGQYEQENRTEEKIKEIIERLDKHRIDERTWRRKEKELNEKIKDLENRLDLYRSKGLLGSSSGDSHLYDKLTQYQTEVQEQKKIIRELKDKVQTCIDNEKRTTSKDSTLQSRIKELEEQVCTLQTEKSSLQTKGDKHQQKSVDKDRKNTEFEGDLENRSDLHRSKGLFGSSSGDSHLYDKLTQYRREVQEQKKIIRELKDKAQTCIDNEKRTTSKDSILQSRIKELEEQVCTLQTEKSSLQTKGDKHQQKSVDKDTQITEFEGNLENRRDMHRRKGLFGSSSGDSHLHDKLTQYQTEVQEQKKIIRELKDKVQTCIDNEKRTTSKDSTLQSRIKELEEQVCTLQTEKSSLQTKGDKHQQKSVDKDRKNTEFEGDLENRSDLHRSKGLFGSSSGDSHLYDKLTQYRREVQEQKKIIRELKDKAQTCIDNEKRTTSKDSILQSRIKELEEQVCTLQTEKSSLQTKGDKHQQKSVDKDTQITEFEGNLENRRDMHRRKGLFGSSSGDSHLHDKLTQYQTEVQEQKKIIRELKDKAQTCIDNEKKTTSKDSILQSRIKELEEQVCTLQTEMSSLQTKGDKHQQKSVDKDRQNTEFEGDLENRRDLHRSKGLLGSSSGDSHLYDKLTQYQTEVQEQKKIIRELKDKAQTCIDNEKRTTSKDSILQSRIKELEEQVCTLQTEKSSLQTKGDKHQQKSVDKDTQITEVEGDLENRSDLHRRKGLLGSSSGDSHLYDKLTQYQTEVQEQKKIIRELKDKAQTCIDNEKRTTSKDSILQSRIKELEEQVCTLQTEKSSLQTKGDKQQQKSVDRDTQITEFEGTEAHKSSPTKGLNSVSVDFKVTVEDLNEESAHLKGAQNKVGSGYRYATKSRFSDLKQHNAFLETRVEHLQKELEEALKNSNGKYRIRLEKQIEKLKEEKSNLEASLEKMAEEMSELRRQDFENVRLAKVKEENVYLETKVSNLEKQVTELKNQVEISQDQVISLQDQLRQQVSGNDDKVRELEQRYHDANLCVSEARAQVSSLQRREKSLQEQLDALQKRLSHGVQDIEDKLQQAQAEKRQAEEARNVAIQEKEMTLQQLERELKLTKSQHEKSSRQYQDLKDRIDHVAKDKGQLNMELQTLKGELATKTHQCHLETKKQEKLMGVCTELEAQIFDLETLTEHYEKKEKEWNKIRHKYERAVDEREEKLEGTSHRLESEQKAKLAACDKVKYMKQKFDNSQAMHRMETDSLSEQLKDAHRTIEKLNARVGEFESTSTKLEMILKSQKDNLDTETREQNKLKEEISRYITEHQKLREANLKLTRNLEEAMDKFELIFGEKVDLENIMEKLQGWHFLEKYRFESHSEQLIKLIDYLQTQKDTNNKKKSKFSFRSKDTTAGGVPMQYKELNNALDMERKRCVKLQEQVDKLRQENFKQSSELLQLKGPMLEKVPQTVPSTPINKNTLSAITNSPSSQLSPIPLLTPRVSRGQTGPPAKTPQPSKQRMRHNIPHKFIKGLNTRATKCAVCLGSVHFVKQATKCQECRLVVHPKCQGSVQATCGLPTEYIQHFAKIMDTLKSTEPNQLYPTLELEKSVKIQSWMKITRSNKSAWERKWLKLEGSLLMIFNDETDASPVDTFDLNPPNADVTVHSAVTTAELSSTVGTDLPFIIRLDMTPHTTCWPGRTLYLMTANFSDKQRWVATLEAAVSTCTSDKENRTNPSKLCGRTEIHLEGEKRLELNCCLALTEQIMLLGAEEGLFAYSPQCGKTGPVLVRFGGLDNVYQLTYVPALYQVLLITGKHRQILSLDKRVIEAKMREGNLEECVVIPSQVVEGTPGCTVFDVGSWNRAHYLCVGMAEKVVLMKYSSQHNTYIAKKDFNAPEPCSCICITNNYAIIGTYKFYKIDLEKMAVCEFVDSKDNSLAFAAFGAAIHHSYPLAVIRITDIGLPEEFLICFHEFGVFVNCNGRRTRQGDMKWSGLPLGFVYREPFLYVTYFTSIQAIQIPAFSQELKVRQMHVSLPSPRFLGIARIDGGVYFASTNRLATEVILFGDSGSNSPVKPLNFDLQRESIVEKDRQVRFVSPEVETTKSLRRSRSNSSLESCSSVYSISTLQSLDTNASDWSPPPKREKLNRY